MRNPRPLAIFLLLATLALPALAQQRYESEVRQLEQFIGEAMRATKMTGLSVAIMKDDFVYANGFGLADIENNVPARAESSYRMASITKPMTAAAVMKLVEQGKVDLDAEVQTYVPYFPRKPHPVTIRQLLGHLGGISHYKDYDKEGHIRDRKSTREAIAVFEAFDLVAEPGTRFNYSSYGYNLLGAVIEGASGKSYEDYLHQQIWKPLGMSSTRMDDPRAMIPNRVRGYVLEDGKLKNSEYVDISSRFGGGGTRSTVKDMLTFITSLDRVLKRETIEAMWTSGVTKGGNTTRYGLGFGMVPSNGRFWVGHSGSQQETATDMGYLPRARFAYVLASNYENANLDLISDRIALLFLGDRRNLDYYVPTAREQGTLQAIGVTWNNGLGYFDRFGKARTTDPKELAAAFRYFNESVLSGDQKKIGEGRHPTAGEAYVKVGAAIAAQLAKSGADLEKYHHEGDLAFFDDYVRLYRANRSIPRAERFDPAFEAVIGRWRADWARIFTDDVKLFAVSSPADLDRLEKEIGPRFANASIRPNYAFALTRMGENAAQEGDMATAVRTAKLGVLLYPGAENTNGFAGVMALAGGDVEGGKALLLKSRAIDPNGYTNPRNRKNIADALEKMGLKAAADVLRGL